MDDLAVALEAVDAGAEVVRGRSGSDLRRFDKGAGDFATDADLDAEAAILRVLAARCPLDAVVAEESGHRAGTSGRSWFVDPLCGTLNFAAGTGPVAVNVALRDGAVEVAAAVADPLAGEVLWAAGDRSGVRVGGADRLLAPSPASRLVDVNLDSPSGPPPGWTLGLLADAAFWSAFRGRVVSSSLALAWVAAGGRSAYLTDGAVDDSVHFAAGLALCRAAGCVVTDLEGGSVASGRGLVAAADRGTSDHLLELVAAAQRS
jgi:myo-inositol-1(or 4)-monophosphatase